MPQDPPLKIRNFLSGVIVLEDPGYDWRTDAVHSMAFPAMSYTPYGLAPSGKLPTGVVQLRFESSVLSCFSSN